MQGNGVDKLALEPARGLWELIKLVVRLAMPMAGSRLIQMLSGFIGVVMLAHLGHSVLAASALMTATQITIIVIFISILFSMSVVVGQAFGARKYDEIGAIIQQGCILALLITIPLIILFLLADRVLLWAGQLPQLVFYIRQYFHALIWGAPGFVLLGVFQQACYGMLKQRLVIIVNLICLLIFTLSAYVLIYGKLGIASQGVAGLPYAFAIQSYVNVIILGLCFRFQKQFKPLQVFSWRREQNWHYLTQLFRIGWPMCLQFGGELIGFFVITVMTGWLGARALAASQVTQQCLFLFIVPLFAVAEATGILVSQAVGGQRHVDIKRIGDVCIGVTMVFLIPIMTIFIFFPDFLASFYIDVHDPNNVSTVHLVRILFALMAFTLVFDSLRNIAAGALRGIYDTRFAMMVGIFVIWAISLPLGYVLAFTWGLGVVGFRISSMLAFAIGASLVWWRWRQYANKFVGLSLQV